MEGVGWGLGLLRCGLWEERVLEGKRLIKALEGCRVGICILAELAEDAKRVKVAYDRITGEIILRGIRVTGLLREVVKTVRFGGREV